MITYIRNLPSDMDTIKEMALEVIKGNSYFAHIENLLISMLTNNDISVRLLAIRRIIAAREKHNMCQSPEVIRHFRMPILDVTATHYSRIISYNNDWLEPRLAEEIPNEEFHIIMIGWNPG